MTSFLRACDMIQERVPRSELAGHVAQALDAFSKLECLGALMLLVRLHRGFFRMTAVDAS
jgi:hypothetical protein